MPLFRRNRDRFDTGFSFSHWLARPFRHFLNRFAPEDSDLGSHAPWHRRLLTVLGLPFVMLYQFGFFLVVSWTTSRRGWTFFWGLPILLIAATVFSTIFVATYLEKRLVFRTLREETIAATRTGDFAKADVCWRRAIKIRDEEEFKYRYAVDLLAEGEESTAIEYLQYLAPKDTTGYAQAHYELGMYYLRQANTSTPDEHLLTMAQTQFERVLELEPASAAGTRGLGICLMMQGKEAEAMGHYERVASFAPDVVPQLVTYKIENGVTGGSTPDELIATAAKLLRSQLDRQPNDARTWFLLYQVLISKPELANLSSMENEFQARMTSVTDPKVRNQLMFLFSELYVKFAELTESDVTQDGFGRRLRSIGGALRYHQGNPNAIRALLDVAIYPIDPVNFPVWLNEEASRNIAPSLRHIVYGLRECLDGNVEDATKHFNLAVEDDDTRVAAALNNIIWIIGVDRDHSRDALSMVDVAINRFPSWTQLYVTRGEILMKLDRPKEALEEFEYADDSLDTIGLHEAMAACLDKLDRPDEAAAQRALAEELKQLRATQGAGDAASNTPAG